MLCRLFVYTCRTISLAETVNTTNRTVENDVNSNHAKMDNKLQKEKDANRDDSVGVEINVNMKRIGDELGDDDDVFLWVDEVAENEKTNQQQVGRDGGRAQEVHKKQQDGRVLVELGGRLLGEWKYWGEDSYSSKGGKTGGSGGTTKSGNGSWTSKASKRCRHPWKGKLQGGGWQGGWQNDDDWQDDTHADRWHGGWNDDECHDCGR